MKEKLEKFDFEGGEGRKKHKQRKEEQEVGSSDDFEFVQELADNGMILTENIFSGEDKEKIIASETPESFEENLPYKPFNPVEELQRINTFSPEEENLSHTEKLRIKKERLAVFKNALLRQQQGVAAMIRKIKERIVGYPDTSAQELFSPVKRDAEKYRLGKEVIRQFIFILGDYEKKHYAVEKYVKQYPNSADLFEVCFGRKPNGKVELVERPMTIHFRIWNQVDYVLAYHYNNERVKKYGIGVLRQEEIWGAAMSGGISKQEVGIPDLKNAVTVENMYHYEQNKVLMTDEIIIHEEQHQFNNLFKPLEAQKERIGVLRRAMEEGKDRESTKQVLLYELTRYFRKIFLGFDSQARDEILAFYADGTEYPEILNKLSTYPGYNYRERYREKIKFFKEDVYHAINHGIIFGVLIRPFGVKEEEIQLWVDKVFGEEYKKDLKKWTDAIGVLEKKGYGRQEILHLLYQTPVNNWPNIARRMKEKK